MQFLPPYPLRAQDLSTQEAAHKTAHKNCKLLLAQFFLPNTVVNIGSAARNLHVLRQQRLHERGDHAYNHM